MRAPAMGTVLAALWAAATRPLLLVAVVVTAGCQEPKLASAPDQPLDKRFQAELAALQTEFKLPGATAAYVLPDGSVGVAAAGLSDVEARTPMTTQSRMLAASTGKS